MKCISDAGIKRIGENMKRVCVSIIEGSYDCRGGGTIKYKDIDTWHDEYVVRVETVKPGYPCELQGVPSVQEASSGPLPEGESSMCDSFKPSGKWD